MAPNISIKRKDGLHVHFALIGTQADPSLIITAEQLQTPTQHRIQRTVTVKVSDLEFAIQALKPE